MDAVAQPYDPAARQTLRHVGGVMTYHCPVGRDNNSCDSCCKVPASPGQKNGRRAYICAFLSGRRWTAHSRGQLKQVIYAAKPSDSTLGNVQPVQRAGQQRRVDGPRVAHTTARIGSYKRLFDALLDPQDKMSNAPRLACSTWHGGGFGMH